MPGAAYARRAAIQRFRLGERDQLLDRARRHRWVQRQHVGRVHGLGDRREVLLRIERQLVEQAGIDRERGDRSHQEGVAVGIGPGHDLGRDIAGRAGAVVHDHLLSEQVGELGAMAALWYPCLRRARSRRRSGPAGSASLRRDTSERGDTARETTAAERLRMNYQHFSSVLVVHYVCAIHLIFAAGPISSSSCGGRSPEFARTLLMSRRSTNAFALGGELGCEPNAYSRAPVSALPWPTMS